jgi:hypothetical protein
MAFEFCRDDATRESYVAALFDYFSSKKYSGYLTLININFLLMGVTMLLKSSFAFFAFFMYVKNIVGCAASTPDGSSPRGYNQKLVSSICSNKSPLL